MSDQDNQQPSDTDKATVGAPNKNVIDTFRGEIAAASSGAVVGGVVGAFVEPVGGILGASVGVAIGVSAVIWAATHQQHGLKSPPTKPPSSGNSP
ncbi:MAG: hypothetical protein MUF49_05240 [Oculatellaceae cyanobacterium Prado106]|nr:hypothetical protein [Oculatellaceae cyanobacterium Prado106]